MSEPSDPNRMPLWGERAFRTSVLFSSVAIFSVALFGMCALFLGVLHDGYKAGIWLPVFRDQFAAVVGIPFSMVVAGGIVLFFRGLHGPIEVQSGPLRFAGATGPVILWILSFLAITISLWLLWR